MHTNHSLQNVNVELLPSIGNVIVCLATVKGSDGRSVSMLGEGSNVEDAQEKALNKSRQTFKTLENGLEPLAPEKSEHPSTMSRAQPAKAEPVVQPTIWDSSPMPARRGQARSNKNETKRNDLKQYNGGGTKEATPAQKNLIQNLAKENRRELEDLCQEFCGCRFDDLRGQDANTIIQGLKRK